MKSLITGSIVALALGVTAAAAQDTTVKTETKVNGDDARAVTMRGCLQKAADNSGFLLLGGVTASGEDLTAKSTVKTDVDDDDTTVKTKTATKIEHDDHDAVGTSGSASVYRVTPRDGVDLATHAGQQVEISAVMIDAKKGGDDDAELKIKEQTTVDHDDAPDAKVETKTKADVPRTASAQLMAMSVKSTGQSCATR